MYFLIINSPNILNERKKCVLILINIVLILFNNLYEVKFFNLVICVKPHEVCIFPNIEISTEEVIYLSESCSSVDESAFSIH